MAARAARGRPQAGTGNIASAELAAANSAAPSPRGRLPQTPWGCGRLTRRLQVAGGHPRLDEDRRGTVIDGVQHPGLRAADLSVLAPLGQQPAQRPGHSGRPVTQQCRVRTGRGRSCSAARFGSTPPSTAAPTALRSARVGPRRLVQRDVQSPPMQPRGGLTQAITACARSNRSGTVASHERSHWLARCL